MAVRYSGDVELRMRAKGRSVVVHIRAPGIRQGTIVKLPTSRFTSEVYDAVAVHVLTRAVRRTPRLPVERSRGRIMIRRVFVSPCPTKI